MLKEWHFNVLFTVAVGGVLFLLLGPTFGLKIGQNPIAISGLGSILAFILTQRSRFAKSNGHLKKKPEEEDDDESE